MNRESSSLHVPREYPDSIIVAHYDEGDGMTFSKLSDEESFSKVMTKIDEWELGHTDAEPVLRQFYSGKQNNYVGYAQIFLALLENVTGYERPIAVDALKVLNTIFMDGDVVDEKSHEPPEATLKAAINGQIAHVVGEGDGPVNAIENALHKALSACKVENVFPEIGNVRLHHYTVPPTESSGSEAKVQVVGLLGSDGQMFTSATSHDNIITASGLMLLDGYDSILTSCRYKKGGSYV